MNEEPIFDFEPLRKFLVDKGYDVKPVSEKYKELPPAIIKIKTLKEENFEFTEQGIYVTIKGNKQQVFLYKKDYHLKEFGKPRFHICKCSTIENFISNGLFKVHYIRANSCPVPVVNLDNDNKVEKVDNLPLCQNCFNMIRKYGNINSTQFVNLLKQINGKGTETEVDILGYTRDWENVSRKYREKHNYTCERCGIQVKDIFDRQYIHCHHKDSKKLNNKESNLECLCIRCHSEVDEKHHKNLTSGANACMLNDFNKKYLSDNHF